MQELMVNGKKQRVDVPPDMPLPGTSAIAPAVANAVYAATGKRIRQLPFQKALQTAMPSQ